MSAKPIDYSKWKDIEVSDDEDETHPNIDTASLHKWRHEARVGRMAEKKLNQEELERDKRETTIKIQELTAKMESASISNTEKKKLKNDLEKAKEDENRWLKKEEELALAERLEKWNIDTISHDAFSSSRVNKITEKQPEVLDEEKESKIMSDFIDEYEDDLKYIAHVKTIAELEAHLYKHPHLACNYASNFLTIEALNLSIESKEEEMTITATNTIILQYLVESAKSWHMPLVHPTVIRKFFQKFVAAQGEYKAIFEKELEGFKERLLMRGKQKRDLARELLDAENKQNRIAQSPGGIDPLEVYDELPPPMREAFDSKDIARLQAVSETMDKEVFAHHFKRCIDSGLWLPDGDKMEQDNNLEADENQQSS